MSIEKFIKKHGSPFTILGLDKKNNYSEKEIINSYKKLSIKYNPDTNNNLTLYDFDILNQAKNYALEIVNFKKKENKNKIQERKIIRKRLEEYNSSKNSFIIKDIEQENLLKFGEKSNTINNNSFNYNIKNNNLEEPYSNIDKNGKYIEVFYKENIIDNYKKMFWSPNLYDNEKI